MSSTADREMVVTRTIKAPRELVFQAFTDPQHVGHWWGPNGFTLTTFSMDVKPGGSWRYVMHGPDGRDYQNKITYLEIVKPERLVYLHGDGSDNEVEQVSFQTTLTFVEQEGKTTVTMRALFPTAQERDRVVKEYGALEGGKQHLARLEGHLEKQPVSEVSDREIFTTRVMKASQALIFRAFADQQRLKNWWGPNGFTNTIEQFDFLPGGTWKLIMHGPDGTDYHNESRFDEIVEPARIVFTHLRPMHRFRMTMTMEPVGKDTRFSFRMLFDDAAECQRVKAFVGPANEQNFDRLEAELANMK